jgi:hypothetical protein
MEANREVMQMVMWDSGYVGVEVPVPVPQYQFQFQIAREGKI